MKETWFGRLGAGAAGWLQALLLTPAGHKAAVCILRGGFGFFLSRAAIFETMAPFGVGWVAASGGGLGGLSALCGSMIGYISRSQQVDAMKYIAIAFLVTAAAIIFRDTEIGKKPLALPIAAGFLSLFIGAVFLFGDGFSPANLLLFLAEVLLTVGSGYFFSLAMEPDSGSVSGMRRGVSLLVLAFTFLLSVSHITLFGSVYPARIAAGIFVLCIAFRNGAGLGSAAGLAAGAAMDLSLGYPFFSMSYGISGLMAGVFRKTNKLVSAVAYVLAGAATVLWAGTTALRVGALLETFAVSILFTLAPIRGGRRSLGEASLEESSPRETEVGRRVQSYAKKRISQCALAFHDVYRSLEDAFSGDSNDEDVGTVYNRTADRLCRNCAMRGLCWDREMSATFQALSDMTVILSQKGSALAEEYPAYFVSRCARFPAFVVAANEEMSALLQRRQYRSRLRESREQVGRQYLEISRVLDKVADEMGCELQFNESAERRIRQALAPYGADLEVTVLRSERDGARVELEGKGLGDLLNRAGDKLVRVIGSHAGYPVGLPEQIVSSTGEKLIFSRAETLRATIGVASHAKQGESESGDHASWYKSADGTVTMILTDGMGSGGEAAAASAKASRLLERFLRSGIDAPAALSTLNSALVLRGGEKTEQYVTVDLCMCDLNTGQCRFYKNGSAPSYIKRDGHISRIDGQGLPVGVGFDHPPGGDMTALRLEAGDTVILLSDGVCGGEDPEWLERILEADHPESPGDFAVGLLEQAVLRTACEDDMMIMTMRLEK